jgi:hypothetical protein
MRILVQNEPKVTQRVFQNYIDKIKLGTLHNKPGKYVHMNMCPEKLPL